MCFYNGTEEQPEEMILSLSDTFTNGKPDIEVKVKMININYGKNKRLMEACKPLFEYSWLVDTIRHGDKDIEKSIDKALEEMPDDFEIKKFLLANKAEVRGMFLTEYDEEKELELARAEAREEARAEALEEGANQEKERLIKNMLQEKMPVSLIAKISGLTENEINIIAENEK